MIRKKILYAFMLMLVGAGCALTACSNDSDENQPSTQGDLEVAKLKALVLDELDQIAFDRTNVNGQYQIGLLSQEDARSLTSLYAGQGFTGQAYTRTLADNKGQVVVSIGNNGVFYQVRFAVADIPPFTLNLADGTEGGNKLSAYHTCDVCGFKWASIYSRCPREKDETYHPKK